MSEKLILAKFGGSSMADAVAIRRSAALAKKQKAQVVVVSATHGTTNQIIQLIELALKPSWNECEAQYKIIEEKHLRILQEIKSSDFSKKLIHSLLSEMYTIAKGVHLLKDCSPKAMDNILSLGERISSAFMADALNEILPDANAQYLEIRHVLITNDNFGTAIPDIQETKKRADLQVKDGLKAGKVYATQGFIGSTIDGFTTTLGRGGSDYSAALIAEAIDADVIQIWTDVAGVATMDPRICPKAKPIPELTFNEAAELATFGAKVLHPTTLWPAMRKNIPVFVGSSIDSQEQGTWIREATSDKPIIRAMALRENQNILTITTPRMLHTYGFLFKVFKIFNDYQISVDLVTTSEISVSLTVNDSTLLNKNLVRDLSEYGEVKLQEKQTLISLVGNGINQTPGLGKKIFAVLENINIRMICMGASPHNICFLVDANVAKEAIQRLHSHFLENL